MVANPSRATLFLSRLATVLLVASIAFGAVLAVGALVGFGPGGDDVAVHTDVDVERLTDLPEDTVSPEVVEIVVRIRDATTAQLRWAGLRDLAPGLLVIAGLWLVHSLLRSVRRGDAFTSANVRRLRLLALVVLIGVPVATYVSSVCASELASSAGFEGPGITITMPGGAFLGGIALLVLTEVFASGVRLRDDLEGTV